MNDDILTFFGLIRRAGKLTVGEDNVRNACRGRQAQLVLLAEDASDNALDRAQKASALADRPLIKLPYDKETISGLLGLPGCSMAAVTDIGFSAALLKKLSCLDPQKYVDALQRIEAIQSSAKQSSFRRK